MNQFTRSELLLGHGYADRLGDKTVAVFGIGGVGSYVAEALARAGVGKLVLVDNDTVCESNINRQIVALHSTLGMYKAEVMKRRAEDINPSIEVEAKCVFFNDETVSSFNFSSFSFVVDAIDSVRSKILLAKVCRDADVDEISCMGAGNKLDPMLFEVTDIYKTSMCPLARVMRHELKKIGVEKLRVVYSTEEAVKVPAVDGVRPVTGSVPFVPPVAGFICAGEVIKKLLQDY